MAFSGEVLRLKAFQPCALGVGLLLLAYSSASLWFSSRLENDPSLERALCHFGICATGNLAERASRELWQQRRPEGAMPGFREALSREATSPQRWCDLGDAAALDKQIGVARKCYAQAEALGPNIPPVLMRLAGFHAARGNEWAKSLGYTSRILVSLQSYDETIFSIYGRPVEDFLKYGLPVQRQPTLSYLRFFMGRSDTASAQKVWAWALAHSFVDIHFADEYAGFLVGNGQCAAAAAAWAAVVGDRAGDYRKSNWIFNGDFEFDPVGFTLDWQLSPAGNVETKWDKTAAYSGSRSLRIQFHNSGNTPYNHVTQTICVEPGTYRFEAHVRAEDISGEQGIRFHVFDRESPGRLDVLSDRVTGTTSGWQTVKKTFGVPGQTRLLQLWIERQPSGNAEGVMQGTVWIDRVTLERVR